MCCTHDMEGIHGPGAEQPAGRAEPAHLLPAPGPRDGYPLHPLRAPHLPRVHGERLRRLPVPRMRPRRLRHGPRALRLRSTHPRGRHGRHRPPAPHQDPGRRESRALPGEDGGGRHLHRPVLPHREGLGPGTGLLAPGRRGRPVVPAGDVDVPARKRHAHPVQHAQPVVDRWSSGGGPRPSPLSGALLRLRPHAAAPSPTCLPRRPNGPSVLPAPFSVSSVPPASSCATSSTTCAR